MANWQRVRVPVPSDRVFHTPFGETIRSPLCVPLDITESERATAPSRTPEVYAWFDSALAYQWFRRAKALLDDTAAIAALDNKSVSQQNPAQCQYAYSIVEAIANGFNAMNVPWYMHQPSRENYWYWISGRPASITAAFDKERNWNDADKGWYTAQNQSWVGDDVWLPLINDTTDGLIPRQVRNAFTTRVPRGVPNNRFVQTIGIGITPTGFGRLSEAAKNSLRAQSITSVWYYQPSLTNQPFVMAHNAMPPATADTFCGHGGTTPLAIPYHCDVDLPGDGWLWTPGSPLGTQLSRAASNEVADDWRSFRADLGVTFGDDPHTKVSAGPKHYFEWLRNWVDIMLATTPQEIILSVREFATYWNFYVIRMNAGVANAIAGQWSQATTANPTLTAVGATAAGLGAALSGVTYGISAVVGALVAGTIAIYNALPDGAKIGEGRDDLGRIKIILERSWLAGDPALDTAESKPDVTVPEPSTGVPAPSPFAVPSVLQRAMGQIYASNPGFARVATPDAWITTSTPNFAPPPPPSAIPTWYYVAGGLAVVAAGGAIYYFTRPHKNPWGESDAQSFPIRMPFSSESHQSALEKLESVPRRAVRKLESELDRYPIGADPEAAEDFARGVGRRRVRRRTRRRV